MTSFFDGYRLPQVAMIPTITEARTIRTRKPLKFLSTVACHWVGSVTPQPGHRLASLLTQVPHARHGCMAMKGFL
jgi:hypothetical protein